MQLSTTLAMAAAAAIINLWLGMRIGRIRHAEKISVGDGGNDLLTRRMRAQLNFAENTPLFLILVGGIELAGKGGVWLAPVAGVFMLGRVAHAIGMDGKLQAGRMFGALSAMIGMLGLAVVAVLISLGKF
ncbi:MAG: MAPEG family protein [Sphingomonadales bacterium]|nr:MAPEG family protein [Sphingomonadales bacterium]